VPSSQRLQRHRERLGDRGLKRVEVVVPTTRVEELKAFAERLRNETPAGDRPAMRQLAKTAFERYGSSYLDNIRLDPDQISSDGAVVIGRALIQRGDKEAFALGRDLLKAASWR
jgi:hypothetical protein